MDKGSEDNGMRLRPEEIEELRELLEREVRKLERSLRSSARTNRPVKLDQQSVGRLSRMDALQNQGMSQRLTARGRQRMEQLLEALDRLDAGTYGRCANCGEAIRYERLCVFPETAVCGGCG